MYRLTLNRTTLLGDFIISVIVCSSFCCDCCDIGGAGCKNVAGGGLSETDGIDNSFSWIIRPPRFDVFSTCKATDIPCSFLPRPWPSLKPYLAIIFAATELDPYAFVTLLFCRAGMIGVLSCNDGGGATEKQKLFQIGKIFNILDWKEEHTCCSATSYWWRFFESFWIRSNTNSRIFRWRWIVIISIVSSFSLIITFFSSFLD